MSRPSPGGRRRTRGRSRSGTTVAALYARIAVRCANPTLAACAAARDEVELVVPCSPSSSNASLATIPVMGVVALIVFLLLRLSPGDPAAVIAGDYATAEQIEKIRTQLGLEPADPGAVHQLARRPRARRSRRLDLLQSARVHADRRSASSRPLMLALHHDHVLGASSPCRSACSRPGRRTPGSTAP